MPDLQEDAPEGSKTCGIVTYGVPIGDDAFVLSFLIKNAERIAHDLQTIGERMSPHKISAPEVPARQLLWQLILRSLQHKGNYWCRHLPDDVTALFSKTLDKEIEKLVLLAISINLTDDGTTVFTKERCRLPVSKRGWAFVSWKIVNILSSLAARSKAFFSVWLIERMCMALQSREEYNIPPLWHG